MKFINRSWMFFVHSNSTLHYSRPLATDCAQRKHIEVCMLQYNYLLVSQRLFTFAAFACRVLFNVNTHLNELYYTKSKWSSKLTCVSGHFNSRSPDKVILIKNTFQSPTP